MALPPLSLAADPSAPWPPDPIAKPEWYDGVTLRRVLAYLVDVLVIGLLVVVLHVMLGIMTIMSFGLLAFLHLLAWPLLVALIYHPLLMCGPFCATLGMRLFGLRVHSILGGPASLPQTLVHTVCFYGTLGVSGGLLLLVALFNPRRRTLHDLLAGTIVLRAMEG